MLHLSPFTGEVWQATQRVLEKMQDACSNNRLIKFYLTGSRAFGNASPFSDYDFFTWDEKFVRDWLEQEGFHLVNGGPYAKDNSTTALYAYPKDPAFATIHVQLIEDYTTLQDKRAIQEFFIRTREPLPISPARWNNMLDLFNFRRRFPIK